MAASDQNAVEITPAMENAGVWALRTAGIGLLSAEDWEVREVAREVFLAMSEVDAGRPHVPGAEPKNAALSRPTDENMSPHK